MKEIRWIYRFKNFERAFILFRESLEIESPSQLEKEGAIQRFEYKLRLAYQNRFIEHSEVWLKMIKDRNLLSHTYREDTFTQILNSSKTQYLSCLNDFYLFLKKEVIENE